MSNGDNENDKDDNGNKEVVEEVKTEEEIPTTTQQKLANHLADSPTEYFVCGSFGGMLGVLVGHPFDTLKIRLQMRAEPGIPYTGVRDYFKKIIVTEGIAGLYKGMSMPLVGVLPGYALGFTSYKIGKILLTPGEHHLLTYGDYFLSGMFSGLVTATLVAPADQIKGILQVQKGTKGTDKYKGPLDVVKKLYRRGGLKLIYRGYCATVLRDVPACGLYFLTYEAIRDELTDKGQIADTLPGTILGGGLAGIAYCTTMPVDVLKSRLQTAEDGTYPGGLRQVLVQLLSDEGFRGLYKGMIPLMIRSFASNAACFTGFEMLRGHIRRIAEDYELNN